MKVKSSRLYCLSMKKNQLNNRVGLIWDVSSQSKMISNHMLSDLKTDLGILTQKKQRLSSSSWNRWLTLHPIMFQLFTKWIMNNINLIRCNSLYKAPLSRNNFIRKCKWHSSLLKRRGMITFPRLMCFLWMLTLTAIIIMLTPVMIILETAVILLLITKFNNLEPILISSKLTRNWIQLMHIK